MQSPRKDSVWITPITIQGEPIDYYCECSISELCSIAVWVPPMIVIWSSLKSCGGGSISTMTQPSGFVLGDHLCSLHRDFRGVRVYRRGFVLLLVLPFCHKVGRLNIPIIVRQIVNTSNTFPLSSPVPFICSVRRCIPSCWE